ncbi:XdhC family protein [Oscillospiraceae bacterium LTW-04]|nr:XdhC family protein [Oscillospiraceae bacterium MB24-C1]
MRNMCRTIAEKLRLGEDLVLVTVIASSGATPRGAGARMLIGKEGRICGTIGGGAVELRSEHIASDVLKEKQSGEHDFSLTKDDVQNLGMICGGAVNVLFRYIPAGDADTLRITEEAERRFKDGDDLWLLAEISDGGRLGLYSKKKGFFGIDAPDWVSKMLTRHPQRQMCEGRDFYVEQIYSSGRVYIFGCGHVAQQLVPVLQHVDFRCVAMDDRPEFADPAVIPSAESVMLIDFERIADFVTIGEEDYVCIMTRGHAYDLTVQAQILKTPAYYIGVIGSAAKKASVYKSLYEMGFTKTDTDRITSPIGLAIKAETPAEIAISIAGQMIAQRALRNAK